MSSKSNGNIVQYCVVGRRDGHQVWFCGKRAPKMWSRGSGWAICTSGLKDITSHLALARRYNEELNCEVKKIQVVKITTHITTEEKFEYIENES